MPDTLPPTLAKRSRLDAIQQPIAEDLKAFRQHYREAMKAQVPLLGRLVQYLYEQKGKQIRPALVLLSAQLCGTVGEKTYRGAALVELLHTATLVHDDVVDESEKRRGIWSINALWGNKVAVLFGDFLLSRGLLLALDHKDYDLLHTVSNAVRRMSEGELLQIEKARRLDIDEATYFQIISDKTASLFAACTAIGAQSTTLDETRIAALREVGEKLGLAFQIKDDLFDFGVEDVGKPLGIDLKEKKMTLPLIHALEQADTAERRQVLSIVRQRKQSADAVRTVGRFVQAHGGLAYAEAKMTALTGEVRTLLLTFPESEARTAFLALVDYVVTRKK